MANLKIRLEKVCKSAKDLLHALPDSFFTEKKPRHSYFIDSPEEVKLLGDAGYFHRMPIHKLIEIVKKEEFDADPKVKGKLDQLNFDLAYYVKGVSRKRVSIGAISVPLEKMPTKQLKKKMLSVYSPGDYDDFDTKKEIKNILNQREHVLSSAQSKLVRKMSIHAGKKLTLKEAQLLFNRLNKKS
jgi:hypothetical protein